MESGFSNFEFSKSQFLKKPVLKNCFGFMHATLKAIGSRWAIFLFGKKLCNSFQGKQETLSHFSRKPASFTPKESIQASCRSFQHFIISGFYEMQSFDEMQSFEISAFFTFPYIAHRSLLPSSRHFCHQLFPVWHNVTLPCQGKHHANVFHPLQTRQYHRQKLP